jgi:transposase-like protein
MKPYQFRHAQIVGTLRERESDSKPEKVCQKHGISKTTFYRWRAN